MLLAVDIGNTKIKAAVFEGTEMVTRFVFEKKDSENFFSTIFSRHKNLSHTILSSVGKDNKPLLDTLKGFAPLTEVGSCSPFPFQNLYETPHTLGIDRMVLSAGAVLQFPGQNRLVIDAGTCVTYDFTDAENQYHGGAISPGLQLRYDSMHNFTAKLPLLYPEMPGAVTGKSTAQSMHSGVVNGLLFEIEGFISHYKDRYGGVKVILTGGDAEFLAGKLKNTIFANSNFLLESLNKLYLLKQT